MGREGQTFRGRSQEDNQGEVKFRILGLDRQKGRGYLKQGHSTSRRVMAGRGVLGAGGWVGTNLTTAKSLSGQEPGSQEGRTEGLGLSPVGAGRTDFL